MQVTSMPEVESRTIAPTDNRSHAKFDRADIRSYDVLTERTVAPSIGAIVLRSACPDTPRVDWDKFSDPHPPPDGNFFKYSRDIIYISTNYLARFGDEEWTVNVTCRELTRFYYSHIKNKSCQRARLIECLTV
ncbi:hypothetical protein DPMN_135664 [Dreissena polymorpha]|uniref:Uncharacterized protein n=1 Tax=Dreissena polymorpha TaxID=45954 RepID=A0A9D4FZI4_DREPO|nr:hypothetical protein DPMN_135664 [Dreissena polymorpha]